MSFNSSKTSNSECSLSSFLKTTGREQLINIIKSIKGRKDLVLDNDLTPVLDLIVGISHLKTADVERIFRLEAGPSPGENRRCVYFVRPSLVSSRLISEQVTIDRQNGKTLNQYYVVYVPSRVFEYERPFELDGTYDYVNILELPLGLFVLDTDLFSLEITDFFSTFFLDGDFTWLSSVSKALLQLQGVCGVIPNLYGQGRCAEMVIGLMERLKANFKAPEGYPKIEHMILVDRDVDYASLLMTQVNYSGLLDELFDFKRGKVTLDPKITGKPDPLVHPLNSTDEIFLEIRDKHFTNAFTILKYKVEQLKTKHIERKGMNPSQIKQFVTEELRKVQQDHLTLTLLVSASQAMNSRLTNFHDLLNTERALIEGTDSKVCMTYIEDCINQQYPVFSTLRLLCLLSICQDGLSSKDYKTLATLFLQSYGHEHLGTLHSLKRLGLFLEQQQGGAGSISSPSQGLVGKAGSVSNPSLAGKVASVIRKSTFRTVVKKLNLIPTQEAYDFRLPPDSAYVFHGTYVPFVCRFTDQALSKEGLQKVEEALKFLPGPTIQRKIPLRGIANKTILSMEQDSSRTVLVFFLGGVTQAEISALRFLGTQRGYTILIGTTSVVNGASLLKLLSTGPE